MGRRSPEQYSRGRVHVCAQEQGRRLTNWDHAVTYYATFLVQHDLLFGEELAKIKESDWKTQKHRSTLPRKPDSFRLVRLGTEPLFDRSL